MMDAKTEMLPLASVSSRLSVTTGLCAVLGSMATRSLHWAIIALAMSTLMQFAFIAFHRTLSFVGWDFIVGGRSCSLLEDLR